MKKSQSYKKILCKICGKKDVSRLNTKVCTKCRATVGQKTSDRQGNKNKSRAAKKKTKHDDEIEVKVHRKAKRYSKPEAKQKIKGKKAAKLNNEFKPQSD